MMQGYEDNVKSHKTEAVYLIIIFSDHVPILKSTVRRTVI